MKRSVVLGVGSYLPPRIMENHEFAARLDTSDEWIVERTGIRQRHIADKTQTTSALGAEAAKAALTAAGIGADSIDLVILATTTPDETMPASATRIQHRLGIAQGAAFDLNAACSGFIYALTVADGLLKAGRATRALVIGAETYSRIVDWEDRGTCILFGDGAGAMVLEAQPESAAKGRGVLYAQIGSDGQYGDLLNTTGGVSTTGQAGVLRMAGREVFRHAVARMTEGVTRALEATGNDIAALDWLVPHQANARILASVAQKLGVAEDHVISTVALHANTSAASIPLALATAAADGRLKPGNLVAMPALGAGFTWGTALVRF